MTLERLRRLTQGTTMQTLWLGAPLLPWLVSLTLPGVSFQGALSYWLAGGMGIGVFCLANASTRSQRFEIGLSVMLQLWLLLFARSPLAFLLPLCGYLVYSGVRAELTGRDRYPFAAHGFLLALLIFAMTEDFRILEPGLHDSLHPVIANAVADPVCVVVWLFVFWKSITLMRTLRHLEAVSMATPEPQPEPEPEASEPEEEAWHN